MFICLGEPEGKRVFWGYLCGGDSWAESYKLTPITMTSGFNQIPLLLIEDMWTDTTSSDVVIYQSGPATLNVKTFLHHVKLMGCYVPSICCVKWFLSARASHHETFNLAANVTQRDRALIYSQQWLLCLLMLVSTPAPPWQKPSREKKDEKAKSLADHWSMTQLWKSLLSNQIVRLEGAEVPQSCPGPLNVTDQLRGVNVHFSQLSRTGDGGKGKQKSTEVISLTNIESLKRLIGLWKKLKWLKLPNVQLPTQVVFAFVETHLSTF